MLYLLLYFLFCFHPIIAEFETANRIQPRVPSLFMRRSSDEPLLRKFREFEKNVRVKEKDTPEFHNGPNLMQVLRDSMRNDIKKVKKALPDRNLDIEEAGHFSGELKETKNNKFNFAE